MEGAGPSRDFIGYGRRTPKGRWPNDAKVALSVVVNYEEGSEHSFQEDGRNESLGEVPRRIEEGFRDLGTESVYEFGSRVGIFRLLRLFDKLQIKCTVFAAAQALERNPEAAAWIRESNHEVCAHGFRWTEAWRMSADEERVSIRVAVQRIAEIRGERPVGWYSRWMPSVRTRELLVEEGGFLYDSDAYNDETPYYVFVSGTPHLVVPYTMTYNDSFFSYGHMTSPDDFLQYLCRGLDYLLSEEDEGLRMMSVGLHPRLIGQAGRTSAVAEFLTYAIQMDDVWIATRSDIARWWTEHHPA